MAKIIGKIQKQVLLTLMDEGEVKSQSIHKITKLDKPAIANALYQLRKQGLTQNNFNGWSLTDEGLEFVRQNQDKILPRGDVREAWNPITETLEPIIKPVKPPESPVSEEKPKEVSDSVEIPIMRLKDDEKAEMWESQAKTWEKSYFQMVDRMFEITKILAERKNDN